MSWGWGRYKRNSPRPVSNGVTLKSRHGSVGETWWSKQWINALESFNEDERLARGRSYARRGQVVSIDIQKGAVTAKVQGSQVEPYIITINLTPFSDNEWEKVVHIMASQAIFGAKLLAGEMPQNIEEAFNQCKISLFPTTEGDLRTNCTCPDWANPCKHIAAVYYILAEKFDEDPFLIFRLRGKTKEAVTRELREKRGKLQSNQIPKKTQTAFPNEKTLGNENSLGDFWKAGQALNYFAIKPVEPDVDGIILKRLGKGPFANESENQELISTLNKAYHIASKAALEALKRG